MCGVAGIIHLNGEPVSQDILKGMTDAIAHRGPDGEGHWIEGNVGLGHRRLAIIDLSPNASQPMISGDDRYIFSYNGEIYNFRELRAELHAVGYKFRSESDTEVVLNALAHWGTAALERLNGMFAFALWDRKEHRMTLARDRYGVKPLYIAQQGNCIWFASEQKAILSYSRFQRAVHKISLREYLTFQNSITDKTLLKDIKLLPGGHYISIELDSGKVKVQRTRYWDFWFREPTQPASKEEYVEELDRLFNQAVNRQMVGDVEIGAYLSGGIDSGSITAVAASQFPNIKTFTCGFDLSSASGMELGFDERVPAEAMSAQFKTEHYEFVLKAGDMERCLPELAWHLEEPRVGQSYPNYYVARLAGQFVKVVMSGAGGDELFGGYPWRYYRAMVSQDFEHYVNQYYLFWQRLVPNRVHSKLFSPIWDDVKDVSTRDIFRNVFLKHENDLSCPEDFINHSLYFEAKTFLHGLFVMEDKLSMAHSLETRVPFMDNDLVEFAMQCPVNLKLSKFEEILRINENIPGNKSAKYFKKTNDGKMILRDVMSRYIPLEIAQAEKQGFSSPDASWFKGESIEFVKRKLFNDTPAMFEFLDAKVVRGLVQDHLDGRENRRLLIWSLLNVQEWIEKYEVRA